MAEPFFIFTLLDTAYQLSLKVNAALRRFAALTSRLFADMG
ncbi:hypothetical protein SAMN02745725_01647 [Pseudobutyrivibrio xylanivorans DSM 14809]|uniref:Uncharacterized protein n=1 Tax=Pseudobutyrivibrio xylanivorans DSM 14809 TaxID=1123012 RepID=A0A1M6G1Q5_PSEXY|nr:hypothetical protein SAMN02745725_01647 [Pseudobutyrivibrio xylanivorans DSM 14809]